MVERMAEAEIASSDLIRFLSADTGKLVESTYLETTVSNFEMTLETTLDGGDDRAGSRILSFE